MAVQESPCFGSGKNSPAWPEMRSRTTGHKLTAHRHFCWNCFRKKRFFAEFSLKMFYWKTWKNANLKMSKHLCIGIFYIKKSRFLDCFWNVRRPCTTGSTVELGRWHSPGGAAPFRRSIPSWPDNDIDITCLIIRLIMPRLGQQIWAFVFLSQELFLLPNIPVLCFQLHLNCNSEHLQVWASRALPSFLESLFYLEAVQCDSIKVAVSPPSPASLWCRTMALVLILGPPWPWKTAE